MRTGEGIQGNYYLFALVATGDCRGKSLTTCSANAGPDVVPVRSREQGYHCYDTVAASPGSD